MSFVVMTPSLYVRISPLRVALGVVVPANSEQIIICPIRCSLNNYTNVATSDNVSVKDACRLTGTPLAQFSTHFKGSHRLSSRGSPCNDKPRVFIIKNIPYSHHPSALRGPRLISTFVGKSKSPLSMSSYNVAATAASGNAITIVFWLCQSFQITLIR